MNGQLEITPFRNRSVTAEARSAILERYIQTIS